MGLYWQRVDYGNGEDANRCWIHSITELFQRFRGSRPEVSHQEWSPHAVVRGLLRANSIDPRPIDPWQFSINHLFLFPFLFRCGMQPYIEEIFTRLRGDIFRKFVESDKYTRFCQWKNLELNIQVTTASNHYQLQLHFVTFLQPVASSLLHFRIVNRWRFKF